MIVLPNINMQFCRNQFLLRRWQVRCSSAGVWRHLGLLPLLSSLVALSWCLVSLPRHGQGEAGMETPAAGTHTAPLVGVDGNPLQVLVATVFLLARCGLGFRVLQYGYVGADFPEPSGLSRRVMVMITMPPGKARPWWWGAAGTTGGWRLGWLTTS